MTQITLSVGEVALVIEALNARASRHESESRYKPKYAGPHDRKAVAMRELVAKLQNTRTVGGGRR